MTRKFSPLLLLGALALQPLATDTAHAGRRKLAGSVPDVTQRAPRTLWSFVSKAFATQAAGKVKAYAPARGEKLAAAPLLQAAPRRPLGPVPIIVISPPKPVVSNP